MEIPIISFTWKGQLRYKNVKIKIAQITVITTKRRLSIRIKAYISMVCYSRKNIKEYSLTSFMRVFVWQSSDLHKIKFGNWKEKDNYMQLLCLGIWFLLLNRLTFLFFLPNYYYPKEKEKFFTLTFLHNHICHLG